MNTGTVLAIAIPVLVILAAVVAVGSMRRRDTGAVGSLSRETRQRDSEARYEDAAEPATPSGREVERAAVDERTDMGTAVAVLDDAPPAPWVAPDPEVIAVTRRQFLNRGMVTTMILGLSSFGAACIAFLWPRVSSGFGGKVKVGTVTEVEAAIDSSAPAVGFGYFPQARAYITRYPAAALPNAESVYSDSILAGMRDGYVALWQKCPHLGCRVPSCEPSQWFECPCHGSQYNRVGEKRGGPAPRGMDRFPLIVEENGNVLIDTGGSVLGPPIGTDTTNQGAEGPHCLSDSEGHG